MPDGHDLLFGSTRTGGVFNVYRQAADGSGAANRLSTSGNQQFVHDVLRDGSQALVVESSAKGTSLLLMPTVAGEGKIASSSGGCGKRQTLAGRQLRGV